MCSFHFLQHSESMMSRNGSGHEFVAQLGFHSFINKHVVLIVLQNHLKTN